VAGLRLGLVLTPPSEVAHCPLLPLPPENFSGDLFSLKKKKKKVLVYFYYIIIIKILKSSLEKS
jgi:hypothetical protein